MLFREGSGGKKGISDPYHAKKQKWREDDRSSELYPFGEEKSGRTWVSHLRTIVAQVEMGKYL